MAPIIMKKMLLLTVLALSMPLFSDEGAQGFVSDFQQLLEAQQEQNIRLTSAIISNRNRIRDLNNVKDAKLNPIYLRNILLYSDKRYLDLVGYDECTFYSLLSTQLLRTADGPTENVLIDYLDNFGQWSSAFISKDTFLDYVYRQKCQARKKLSNSFSRPRLLNTLKSIKWNIPQTGDQCSKIWNEWRKDPTLPYICNIPETIEWGKKAEKILAKKEVGPNKEKQLKSLIANKQFLLDSINLSDRTYTTNLCQNIDSEANFCSLYLQQDVWSKIIKEDKNRWKMEYTCNRFISAQDDPLNLFTRCRDLINKKPSICATHFDPELSALYPRQRCDQISDALNVAHLKTDYQDCPGIIDNEAITNTFRILSHFESKSSPKKAQKGCSSKVNEFFAQMAIESENAKAWPMELCYTDRIEKQEVCLPYIPNDESDSALAETSIISQILQKTRGASSKLKCQFLEKNDFRPELLQYKSGCYILRKKESCTTLHCPKEVRYNAQKIDDIGYKGVPTFDYFVNNFGTEKYAVASILEEKYKIAPTLVTNLTEIRFFLGLSPDAIIHGIGCAEAIYPNLFLKKSFNQCTPLPFILDGLVDEGEGKGQVSFRSSIEDVHHPYLIDWKRIFNAVSSYRNIHPNNLWALYGIKK